MNQSKQIISVIGGGVMGLCTAYALIKSGQSATLYDSSPFAHRMNASLMAGGMLAPYSELEYIPADFLPAALNGLSFWENMLKETSFYARTGTLVIAHREDTHLFARFSGKMESHATIKKLSSEELHQQEPNLTRFTQALHIQGEAYLDPHHALQRLSDFIPDQKAEKFEFEHNEDQLTIDCRGYDAHADEQELRGLKGESIIVHNTGFSLQRPVRLLHPRYPIYIVPRENNTFMIGATMMETAGNKPSVKSAMELLSAAYSLHPSFGDSEILEINVGIRPAYPDNLPRIVIENKTIRCNGLFRHGFLLAPVMAACVADYLQNRENPFMHLFRKEPHEHSFERTEKNHQRRT